MFISLDKKMKAAQIAEIRKNAPKQEKVEIAPRVIKDMRHISRQIQVGPKGREEYENIASKLGIEVMSDDEIMSSKYAMENGQFSARSENPWHELKMMLAQRRYSAMINEKASEQPVAPKPAGEPHSMNAQIWEPCVVCGSEPSCLPSHRCERCL